VIAAGDGRLLVVDAADPVEPVVRGASAAPAT
jgi:hypothetical protein